MYYILASEVEDNTKDAILSGEGKYLDRIKCSFQKGEPLPTEDIEVPIMFMFHKYTLRGDMTDHLSMDDIMGPVFSQKVIDVLKVNAVNNIECYQLKLRDEFPEAGNDENQKNKKGEKKIIEYNNYFIANVVGLVDCVDHEQSVVEYYYPPELKQQIKEDAASKDVTSDKNAPDNPNEIDFITKLVLDKTKIDPALKVFRLLDQPDLLVFHESVVEAIKKENLSGFVFVPIQEYTDAIPDEPEEEKQEPATIPVKELPKKETKNKSGFSFLFDE